MRHGGVGRRGDPGRRRARALFFCAADERRRQKSLAARGGDETRSGRDDRESGRGAVFGVGGASSGWRGSSRVRGRRVRDERRATRDSASRKSANDDFAVARRPRGFRGVRGGRLFRGDGRSFRRERDALHGRRETRVGRGSVAGEDRVVSGRARGDASRGEPDVRGDFGSGPPRRPGAGVPVAPGEDPLRGVGGALERDAGRGVRGVRLGAELPAGQHFERLGGGAGGGASHAVARAARKQGPASPKFGDSLLCEVAKSHARRRDVRGAGGED